jgi:SET domain-containing protein
LINHSCDPSCYAHQTYPGLKEDETVAFIALRDIQTDKEITVNYNLFGYDLPDKTKISPS